MTIQTKKYPKTLFPKYQGPCPCILWALRELRIDAGRPWQLPKLGCTESLREGCGEAPAGPGSSTAHEESPATIGALIIRIGFWGPLYYNHNSNNYNSSSNDNNNRNEEPPKWYRQLFRPLCYSEQ